MGTEKAEKLYDFSKETWRKIYAFEDKLRGQKIYKKVHFKEGQKQETINWLEKNVLNNLDYYEVYMIRYGVFKSSKRSTDNYFKNKLEKAFKKNKYYLDKKEESVFEFVLVMQKAKEYGLINEFLDIPDVWYITRKLRNEKSFVANLRKGI